MRDILIFVGVVVVVVGLYYFGGMQPQFNYLPPSSAIPEQQQRFCSIIELATSNYRDLSRQLDTAKEQKNGIAQQRLQTQMTAVFRTRNEDIFHLVQQTSFRFDNWLTTIDRIGSPTETALSFSFRPLCSRVTTIYGSVPATSTHLALMSTKKQGDRLTVTGEFVARVPFLTPARGDSPITPRSLEGSLTEGGSMSNPEYSAVVTLLK
jgi:hypothetical protein